MNVDRNRKTNETSFSSYSSLCATIVWAARSGHRDPPIPEKRILLLPERSRKKKEEEKREKEMKWEPGVRLWPAHPPVQTAFLKFNASQSLPRTWFHTFAFPALLMSARCSRSLNREIWQLLHSHSWTSHVNNLRWRGNEGMRLLSTKKIIGIFNNINNGSWGIESITLMFQRP